MSVAAAYGSYGDMVMAPATSNYSAERQQHWIEVRHGSRESPRRLIAERAEARYGLLLHQLMQQTGKAEEKPFPARRQRPYKVKEQN
jgi:hypothetical protein